MLRIFLFTLVLTTGGVHALQAQNRVGEVSHIARDLNAFRSAISEDSITVVDSISVDTAEVRRAAGTLKVRTSLDLLRRDIVRLKRPVYVRARFEQAGAEGDAFMSPDPRTGRGTYEILPDTFQALTSLQLAVKLGTMVLERVSGRIVTCLTGHCIEAMGTTLLFRVTEEDAVGICYLREGRVRFLASGMEFEGRDRMWELRPGQPPLVVSMDRATQRRFRDDVRFHSDTIWSRRLPLYRRRGFWYAAGGIAAVGTAAYLLFRPSSDNGPSIINVVISLPN